MWHALKGTYRHEHTKLKTQDRKGWGIRSRGRQPTHTQILGCGMPGGGPVRSPRRGVYGRGAGGKRKEASGPQAPGVRGGGTHHFPLLGGLVDSRHHLVVEKQKQRLVRHFPPIPRAPSRLRLVRDSRSPLAPRRWPAPQPVRSGLPRCRGRGRPLCTAPLPSSLPPRGRRHWTHQTLSDSSTTRKAWCAWRRA